MMSLSALTRRRPFSLRARTFLVVCAVTAAPLTFVLGSALYEQLLNQLLSARTEAALQLVRRAAPVAEDVSVVRIGPARQLSFYGAPTHRETLLAHARLHNGQGSRCEVSADGRTHLCASWEVDAQGAQLYAEAQDVRRVRTLLANRAALLKLTVLVLPASLLLALWLTRYVVGPLTRLRSLVLERSELARPRPDLPVERLDEIGDVARSFNVLIERLVLRQEATDAFMQDLAHELKSPLAAVRACAERLAEDAALDVGKAQRLARVLRDSGHKLELVVRDFLDLSSAEAGMRDEQRVPIQLSLVVTRLVDAARARHEQHEWTLRTEEGVLCMGVAARLEAAFSHLLDNAAAFAQRHIHVSVEAGPRSVCVRVQDDGPGIVPEDLPQVFERFFTRRAGAGGTGLGLAVVRAVALAHEGDVEVHCTPGGGASFTFSLPKPT